MEDGKGADRRQAIGGLAEDALQGGKRPGGGAILGAVRGAPELLQDPLLLGRAVLDRMAAAVSPGHRR